MKLFAALVTLFLAPVVLAGDGKGRIVESEQARVRAAALLEKITWQTSLDKALSLAKDQGRLVFWIQMKGRLDGAT
ncbi:MAG TPA: hypothetical protein VI643_04650 [Planctomycetota bacterium]|nr:hypothetical protein [Planctomycetota bacterium]